MSAQQMLNQEFVVIAGTSKAGTTSVFNYFAGHPEICPANVKETRFFLDSGYPLASPLRCEKDGPLAYLTFFDNVQGKSTATLKLEATPDYLYSRVTPRLIHEAMPNARLIFILREPISRLLSFYRFGQSMGEISRDITFDQYVHDQKVDEETDLPESRHPAFYALRHGRYSNYLRSFLETIGRSAIHVAFYEDLCRKPLEVAQTICRFVQIDPTYFDNYEFHVANKGLSVRSSFLHNVYWRSKEKMRSYVRAAPKLGSLLRRIGAEMDKVYQHTNVRTRNNVSMSSSTEEFLLRYYSNEATKLRELLELEVPWGAGGPQLIAREV